MINSLGDLLQLVFAMLPFLIVVLCMRKINFKKENRSKQCFMPIIAVIVCVVAGLFLTKINELITYVIESLPGWINTFANWLTTTFGENLTEIATALSKAAASLSGALADLNIGFLAAVLANFLLALGYVIFKGIVLQFMRAICRDSSAVYRLCTSLVYYYDDKRKAWYVKEHFGQGVTLLKALYYAAVTLGVSGMFASAWLYDNGIISSLYYPVLSVIMVSEIYFYIDGVFFKRDESSVEGEDDAAQSICDYTLMRKILRKTFGDKLMSENTSVNNELVAFRSNDEVVSALEENDEVAVEAYGRFMRQKAAAGLKIDQNYLMSGMDLLCGKSILFNNPFYYDLIPYIFYPMNRTIIRRKKVLIVLGRHAIEEDIIRWCRKGLAAVNHIPSLWNIGVLGEEPGSLDVGIVARSKVHDLKMHEANDEFFSQVEFVVLVEPSRLVTTAQVGLNSIVKHCRRDGKKIVFASVDKNCDGIVDALSHILMTSLEEVAATNKHKGVSSYMCWEVDGEHLQHRMLPNLSRYLGMGTELSFSALKSQVSKTYWYGGDAFPVLDMHWIVKQYYYDLLNYASLPKQQTMVDEVFKTSPNLWDVDVEDNKYITVEDESYNMFEVKREFATRARKHGFINVISTDYLLKDYMSDNDGIFDSDSKAIPYIVADYARTEHNIIYRLCLRLSAYPVQEEDIRKELSLVNIDCRDIIDGIWSAICKNCRSANAGTDGAQETLTLKRDGQEYVFDSSVISKSRKYSYASGKIETYYFIGNAAFVDVFLGDLCSAEYLAEDEQGNSQYLGSELRGHVFQKYLPGQFFTFGGKYYEMLMLNIDGKVIVRRAADHITGRPQYRQVRNYHIKNCVQSRTMGDVKNIGDVTVAKMYADIRVETPSYWRMERYNDFASAKHIGINGIPAREYTNKQVLKLDFSQHNEISDKTLNTLALLINEIFRTLYAENQDMIVAVCKLPAQAPVTYSLSADDQGDEKCIYIIEDSKLDIGLIESAERNLGRIFSTIFDYLKWHSECLEESLNPKPEPQAPDYTLPESQQVEEEKPGIFKRVCDKIKGFFKKLFKRKPKKDKEDKGETREEPSSPAPPAEEPATEEPTWVETDFPAEEEPIQDAEPEPAEVEEIPESPDYQDDPESEAELEEQDSREEEESEHPILLNRSPSKLYSETPDGAVDEDAAPEEDAEENAAAPDEGAEPEAPEEARVEAEEAEADIEFEEDGAKPGKSAVEFVRKPYHERYYLLYGGDTVPEGLDITGVVDLLEHMGCGNGSLEQARSSKDEAARIEESYVPNVKGVRYCDFCGLELTGVEYDVLTDGRERCVSCGKSAVKTQEEFKKIYEDVIRNMKTFYGVTINEPVQIKMVNAKKLHRRLGKTFVPTGNQDGRILGVAIKDKEGYSIYVENGSPRMSAVMTMVHELTHIWQYINWDAGKIKKLYGAAQNLQIYEGMAKWSEIQYAYLVNEDAIAKREEIITRLRDDEYGHGFNKYVEVYPLSADTFLKGATPFDDVARPL